MHYITLHQVSGGSGNYSWHSSNPSAADVQPSGLVSVGSTIGSITVKASDSRNAAHFDTSQVLLFVVQLVVPVVAQVVVLLVVVLLVAVLLVVVLLDMVLLALILLVVVLLAMVL